MAADEKNGTKDFRNPCEGMPFADMMRKMMEAGKAGLPCNCSEMMSRMMKMCCGTGDKEGQSSQEAREKTAPNP